MTTTTPTPPAPPDEWRLLLAGYAALADMASVFGPSRDGPLSLADTVAAGDAAAVLATPTAAAITRPGGDWTAEPDDEASSVTYWDEVEAVAAGVPTNARAALDRLAVGAAALTLFVRANFTGPPLQADNVPHWPGGGRGGDAAPSPRLPHGECRLTPCDAAALTRLGASGEDADAAVSAPQYGALAVEVLLRPLGLAGDGSGRVDAAALADLPPTWPAWALRAVAARQRVLASRAAASSAALAALAPVAAAAAEAAPGWAASFALPGTHCEAAALALDLRDTGAAVPLLHSLEISLGVSATVVGALGVRTAHQADAKAQLVAVVTRSNDHTSSTTTVYDDAGVDATTLGLTDGEPPPTRELDGLATDVDVLRAPRLVVDAGGGGGDDNTNDDAPPSSSTTLDTLPPLIQALLLLRGAAVTRSTADDGLRAWRAAPFAERVAAQPRTRFALAASAAVVLARHERTRGRTRERALVTLERVRASASASAGGSPPASRTPLALATPLPPLHRIAREGADALLATGLVPSALDAYVAVEAWDAVALCYRLLGKPAAARDVLERRLAVRPTDPRLLCSLGDVTGEEDHYHAALRVTGGRSARAHRALAVRAARRKDWAGAVSAWDAALALNPDHTDGWFACGYARLKAGDDPGAAVAFTRVVADDRDHGDAWNNLAAIHLRGGRPAAAFVALQQAVRLKRESWHAWQNYASAALACRAPTAAARGLTHVLELSKGEVRPVDLMVGLVEAVRDARASVGVDAATTGAAADMYDAAAAFAPSEEEDHGDAPTTPAVDVAELAATDGAEVSLSAVAEPITTPRDVAALESAIGAALRAATRTGGGSGDADVWGALAAFSDVTGATVAAREARLKRVRLLSGGGWKDDAAVYGAYVGALVDLAEADVAAAAARARGDAVLTGGRVADLAAAKLALASAVSVARDRFGADAVQEAVEVAARVEEALAVARAAEAPVV